jgi:TRAP-type mannitol/chloroaromatic compound transport system permease small subunit
MNNAIWLLLIFVLLLGMEAIFNTIAGLWSIFWVPLEIIFDIIFFLFIAFVTLAQGNGNSRTVRE